MTVVLAYLGELGSCPRANRLAKYLDGTNLGILCETSKSSRILVMPSTRVSKAVNFLLLLFGFYDTYLKRKFDILVECDWKAGTLICHDLLILPLLLRTFVGSKVIFDVREFYPREFEDRWMWRITSGRLAKYICRTHVPRVDRCITVSRGVANAYKEEFGLCMSVAPSYADFHSIQPTPVGTTIKCVYLGNASPDRKIETMIEAFRGLSDKYSLDLFLNTTDEDYSSRIWKLGRQMENVTIHPPVPFDSIVPSLSHYDIGLFVAPPTTFNLMQSLPNKVFEYLQARLMLVVSPLEEVGSFVTENRLGLVTEGFSNSNIRRTLESITPSEIKQYKLRAHAVAQEMTAETFAEVIANVIAELDD